MDEEIIVELQIHKLSRKQYEREKKACRLDENAMYMTNDAERNFLFIGDSYAQGYCPDAAAPDYHIVPWHEYVQQNLGLVAGKDYQFVAEGGAGFANRGNNGSGNTFGTLLQSAEKYGVTDIVVCGGYNDHVYAIHEPETLKAAIKGFCNYAKSNFPEAKIHIGMIGWSNGQVSDGNGGQYDPQLNKVAEIYSSCCDYGYSYMSNSEFILHDSALFSTDVIHPNEAGQAELGKYITSYLLGGGIDVIKPKVDVDIYSADNLFVLNCECRLHNNITWLKLKNIGINAATTFPAFPNTLTLDVRNCRYFANLREDAILRRIPVVAYDGAKYLDALMRVSGTDGKLEFMLLRINDTGSDFDGTANIKLVQLEETMLLESLYC